MIMSKRRKVSLTLGAILMGLALAACAPAVTESGLPASGDEAASAQIPDGEASPAATDTPWSMNSDCSVCHSTQAASLEDTSCLVSTHGARGVTCTTCHSDAEGLTSVHGETPDASKLPKRLKKTKVENSTCIGCHGDWEELPTEGIEPVADKNGVAVQPHEAWDLNEDHQAQITCVKCHGMHEGTSAAQEAQSFCISCHHQGVFQCGTCHEKK